MSHHGHCGDRAPLSFGSTLTAVLVTIRSDFKPGDVLTIRVDGHGGGPIVEVTGLREDAEPQRQREGDRATAGRRNLNGRW